MSEAAAWKFIGRYTRLRIIVFKYFDVVLGFLDPRGMKFIICRTHCCVNSFCVPDREDW